MNSETKALLEIPSFLKIGHPDNDKFIEKGIETARLKDPKYVPIQRKKKIERKKLLID